MKLTILTPVRVEVDQEARKVCAEGQHGAFCVLPRHVDFVAALVPGLLSFEAGGRETFVAVDGGTAVKCGQEVRVSTPRAVRGPLGELSRAIDEEFRKLSEREAEARTALEKMRADFLRRFMELQSGG